MERLKKLENIIKDSQAQIDRLSKNIERLTEKMDTEFGYEPDDECEGIYDTTFICHAELERPSRSEKELFLMAVSNLTFSQLVIILDAMENRQHYDYCNIIKQRMLDLRSAEERRSRNNNII